jgi:hypothetical protein
LSVAEGAFPAVTLNRQPFSKSHSSKDARVIARLIVLALLIGIAASIVAIRAGYLQIPDRYNPWAPLVLDAEPNFLTRVKLARLSKDRQLCQDVLASSGFAYATLPDRITGYACGFHNAVRIERTSVRVGEPFSLSCRAAVSLALWERHALQPQALALFGQRVARIEHYGSYACRNVYGRPRATRSRHATAEALDIAGFILEDGSRIRVLKDWSEGRVEAKFLHAVRDGACEFFDGVLSPDYNAAHEDHFHLDRGTYRVCR